MQIPLMDLYKLCKSLFANASLLALPFIIFEFLFPSYKLLEIV